MYINRKTNPLIYVPKRFLVKLVNAIVDDYKKYKSDSNDNVSLPLLVDGVYKFLVPNLSKKGVEAEDMKDEHIFGYPMKTPLDFDQSDDELKGIYF